MEGRVGEVVRMADGWEALGKAVLAENEPRSQIFSVQVANLSNTGHRAIYLTM